MNFMLLLFPTGAVDIVQIYLAKHIGNWTTTHLHNVMYTFTTSLL